MIKSIKPFKLNKGNKIALISPCWGGPFLFPKLLEKAIENVKAILEVEVVEFPTCRMSPDELYHHPQKRAADINNAFEDPSISAIFCTIGGSDSIRILEHLNIDVIKRNPKIIMGFSDTSTFLTYLNTNGLVTFHGPSMLAGWAQAHNYPSLCDHYRQTLMENKPVQEIPVFSKFSDGYPQWNIDSEIGNINPVQANSGPYWLQGSAPVRGKLWGGCIEVVDWLKGTPYWPDNRFWSDKILIFETSEEKPSPQTVSFSLRNLGVQGVLNQVQGILFGRASKYSEEEKLELNETIIRIVKDEFGNSRIPVITNLDFGHTDPNMILPLGVDFEINPADRIIQRIERSFEC